jgi:dTDP-4-dehydrorhamnose reductase
MRIVIVGASGQLGTDLVQQFQDEHTLLPLTRSQADVRDRSTLLSAIAPFRPDVVINTAAFHKVDLCEEQPWPAVETNVLGTVNVARVCRELEAEFIHLSTDYVFAGMADRPWREDDPAEPVNVYGATKLAGERLALATWPRTLIVRTSGLFGLAGASGKGGNFVETMLRIGRERGTVRVVTDQVLGPTYTPDLAVTIHDAVRHEVRGTLHVTNSGQCSWHEFAQAIFLLSGMSVDVQSTTSDEFGARARRPAYSVLSHHRLLALGIAEPRPWHEALAAYLSARHSLGDR